MSINHPKCWIASIAPSPDDPEGDMREAVLSLQDHEEFLTMYGDRRQITERAMRVVNAFNTHSPFAPMLIDRSEILELLKEAIKNNG